MLVVSHFAPDCIKYNKKYRCLISRNNFIAILQKRKRNCFSGKILLLLCPDSDKNHIADMYTVKKRLEISASHSLSLSYESKCENLHGHNWIVEIWCRSETLDADGMVIDFSRIKKAIHGKLDHRHLNDVLPFNPTAENLAKWICDQFPSCYKVMVRESDANTAYYEKD